MCGIGGMMMVGDSPPATELLDSLADSLAHRGPDGRGRHVARNVGMVHDRLAIIDLETGGQPLGDGDGSVLIANGEIYNYLELAAAFPAGTFETRSDCEPPLHLFAALDLDYPAKLRGMYAIAIHDPAGGRLVLSRDPFGIKPLYYAETDDGFAFASEARALIAAGLVAPEIRRDRRDELLQMQFTTGRETIFAGINRVAPGETIVVREGRIVERRRISALPEGGPEDCEEAAALDRLDAALTDSVRIHQRSDVPYGMFLSGGIDSACLLAVMARLNERPVQAFTAGFSGTGVADERESARRVADALGAEHIEVEFGEEDFWSLLPQVCAAMDDPAADYAILPTYKLASIARKTVKVVLTGEGGDELFAGYGRYRGMLRPWWRGGRMMRGRGTFDGLGVLRQSSGDWRDGIASLEITEARPGRSRLQIAQAVDCGDWLAHDLLTKLDRCLMAHGIEGRTPFLDPVVAEAAFRLPEDLKIRDGMGKWLLRRWLARALPVADSLSRKRGFTVPVAEWIARRGAELGPLVAAQSGIAEICQPGSVAPLFGARRKRAGFAAWTLLFYSLWHGHHLLGLDADGDVFETLTEGARIS